jgi:3-phosphoshikimate 1-carboxyvinyltransferase
LRGEVTLPGDKSISHRALILAAYSPHPIAVRNLNSGRDVQATAGGLARLSLNGARDSHGEVTIDCMNSGSTARMLLGVCAGANLHARFEGDESLSRRPMEPVAAHLRAFGARIDTTNGCLPASIRGRTQPQTTRFILVTPSAQIKTALLFASVFSGTPVSIRGDKNSRDHTERLLRYFDAGIAFDGSALELRSGPRTFRDVDVPADFSAAAFFIVAATVSPSSRLRIPDVGLNPTRTGLLDALVAMGANIRIENARERCGEPIGDVIVSSATLHAIDVGHALALRAIDEIPVLAIAAAFANGTTRITGIHDLRTKESDRVAAIERLLGAAGIQVETLPNGIAIHGGSPRCNGAVVQTRGDHRTAMAAAALACGAGALEIDDEECTNVSFPSFTQTLRRVQT